MTITTSSEEGTTVECLTTFDQFRILEQEWEQLSAQRVDTIFLSYLWLQEWWHIYGADYQIWTLAARQGGKLIGVMPLILSRALFGIRRLMFMGVGELTPNHLDVITDPEKRDQVFRAFVAHLCQRASVWDVLELDKIPGDSSSMDLLSAALRAEGLSVRTEISATCPYIELPASFEEYLASRGSTTRESYRRVRRKLEKDFPAASYGMAQTPEEVRRVMGALIQLHQARWLQQGFLGSFSNQEFIDFHCTMAQKALRSNMLRLYYLQVNDEIIAVYYCYRIADSVQFYLGGFDERYSKYSPGILINAFAIEQSILEGAKHFDFLEGEERYKQHWMTHSRENLVLRAFRRNGRGRLAEMNLGLRRLLVYTARRFLPEKTRLAIRRVLQRLHISI